MLCSGNGLLLGELRMSGETRYRKEIPLAISGTQTLVLADCETIGASALNCFTIVRERVYYLIAVAVQMIVVKADFAHLAYKYSEGFFSYLHFPSMQCKSSSFTRCTSVCLGFFYFFSLTFYCFAVTLSSSWLSW